MKHPVFYTAIILILTLSGGMVLAGQTMTLEDCLAAAIANNPSLKASQYSVDEAAQDIKSARAEFFPSVSSGYSVNSLSSISSKGPADDDSLDQNIRAFNLGVSQILYAGSRIVNTYDRAKLNEQMIRARKDLEKLELVYRVETTFYKLMKARQDVIIVSESVARLTESLKVADAFFRKELIPYGEVLQTRVDLSDAREQLSITRNNVERERATLYALMNIPLYADIDFSDGLANPVISPPSFDVSLDSAMKNRPDIRVLEYQFEIAKKNAAIAMGKYLPTVRLNVAYHDQDRNYAEPGVTFTGFYDRDQRNRYWSAGAYATWDLFDGGRSWYVKQRHTIEAKKITALMEDAKNNIATGIQKALYSLSDAAQRIENSTETMSAAHEYYAGEEKRLKAGISTIPSFLDAQFRLVRAQGNKIRAVLDYQLAQSELKLMTGESIHPTEKQ